MSVYASSAPRARRRAPAFGPAGWLLVLGVGAWTVVVVALRADLITVAVSPRVVDVFVYGVPACLVGALVVRRGPSGLALKLTAWWSLLIASALALAPELAANPTIAYAAPVVAATAAVLARWPALGVGVVVIVTAAFGSLSAFFSFPTTKSVNLCLAALWIASLASIFLRTRSRPAWLWPGVALAAAYLIATLIQLVLSEERALAQASFELAQWHMLAFLLVAYAGWEASTHRRIAQIVVAVALFVGAYATFRYFAGPAAEERAQAAASRFNVVDGKIRLGGSFPSGADLGAWTALMVPFALSYALGDTGRWRVPAALSLPLMLIGLLGSGTRASAIAVIAGVAVVFGIHQFAAAFPGLRLGRLAAALLAGIAIAFGGYALTGGGGYATHSIGSLLSFNSNQDKSFSEHQYKWEQALRDLRDRPFGYGLGTGATGYTPQLVGLSNHQSPAASLSVDSGYLKIALEQGLTITALFGLALVLVLGGLARRAVSTTDRQRATIAAGAAGTLAVLMVLLGAGAFTDGLPVLAAWIVIGLGVGQFARGRSA